MSATKGKKLETVTCPVCHEYSSKRLTQVEEHLSTRHGSSLKQEYDKVHGQTMCRCGCGRATTFIGWRSGYQEFIIGHNADIHASYDEQTARALALTRGTNWRGKPSMWKGLTIENDARIEARAKKTSASRKKMFEEGTLTIWSKGQTTETNERLAEFATRQRERFANGELVPWAKGKTKETDEVVARMAEQNSITHRSTALRRRLDDLKRLKVNEIQHRIEDESTLLVVPESLDNYANDNVPNITVRCTKCGTTFISSLRKLQHGRCYTCSPGGSKAQHDIAEWIRTLNMEVVTNDRSKIGGLELDVFVPTHSVAIEYNGLYWHNITAKSSTYHDNKTQLSSQNGITLIHVFEDEWRDKQHIVKSMLRHKLGMTHTVIMARKCSLVQLTTKDRRTFFENNHIDGDTNAKEAWGLMFEGKVVAALSIRSPFHKKHAASLEVARFCCAVDVSVVGGLGRLTHHAQAYAKENKFTTLMSYVDTRFGGTGTGWKQAGWKLISSTPPRFWWTNNVIRYNRFKYKADRSRGMSETQVSEEAGVVKIFGCRNHVYEITI